MKKMTFVFVLLTALFFLFSCNKSSQAPSSPEVNPTFTFTSSATVTSTPTITSSPTMTSTPTPFFIDNFEDNNNENMVPCSNCLNDNIGTMSIDVSNYLRGCYLLSGAPAELGEYAYGLTATVRCDNNKWFALFPQTFSAVGVGTNFSAYNSLKFTYKVETNAPIGYEIILTTMITGMTYYLESDPIVLDRSGNWNDVVLNIDDFIVYADVGVTAAQIMSGVRDLKFYFKCNGDPTNFANVTVSMDNIVFTRQ